MNSYTIKDFEKHFPNEESCLEFLKNARWPKGIYCGKCQKITTHYRIATRKVYSCEFCGSQVSPMADTIFHKSDTPLRSWFHAIFLMASTRTGISAKQLERELGVTYKTAWRIFKQIRQLMQEDIGSLSGEVEVDETYMGGKRPGKRGRGAAWKAIVMGMAQRKGKIITRMAPDVKARTLMPNIKEHVMAKSTVFTDELPSYNGLTKAGYEHLRVHHAAKVYVIGTAHTNTIEGFWSLVKRGIDGVHHVVSHKYLPDYLNEYSFRWNHRDEDTPIFSLLLEQVPSCQNGKAEQLPSKAFQTSFWSEGDI